MSKDYVELGRREYALSKGRIYCIGCGFTIKKEQAEKYFTYSNFLKTGFRAICKECRNIADTDTRENKEQHTKEFKLKVALPFIKPVTHTGKLQTYTFWD